LFSASLRDLWGFFLLVNVEPLLRTDSLPHDIDLPAVILQHAAADGGGMDRRQASGDRRGERGNPKSSAG
jgi:hypothetical protein